MENHRVVNSISKIDACWLLENKVVSLYERGAKRQLPTLEIRYKELLDSLKVSYKEVEEKKSTIGNDATNKILEIWDKDCFEEETVTKPVFTRIKSNEYCCLNEKYKAKTYTKKTIAAANKLKKKLKGAIRDYNRKVFFEESLAEKKAVLVVGSYIIPTGKFKLLGKNYAAKQVLYKDETTGTIAVVARPYITLLVDMDKVEKDEELEVMIPAGISKGKIVGAKGWQAKDMAKFFKVKMVKFL